METSSLYTELLRGIEHGLKGLQWWWEAYVKGMNLTEVIGKIVQSLHYTRPSLGNKTVFSKVSHETLCSLLLLSNILFFLN